MTAEEGGAPSCRQPPPKRERNYLLRQARLRTPSREDPSMPMSQRELAEAATAYIFRTTSRTVALDRHCISRWESGKRRLPTADYRAALRAVLGVATDVELGFGRRPSVSAARRRRTPAPPGQRAVQPPTATTSRTVQPMKVETIRFVVRDEGEAYFIRAIHHLAGGCLFLGVRDRALTALVEVVSGAVEQRAQHREAGAD